MQGITSVRICAQSQSASVSDDSYEEQTSVVLLKRVRWLKRVSICASQVALKNKKIRNVIYLLKCSVYV
jgi:hypothetical protein